MSPRVRWIGAGVVTVLLAGGGSCRRVEVPDADLREVEPQIASAVGFARSQVERRPGSAGAWGSLGDRYLVHEWFEEAAECYRQAEILEPDNFVWAYRRGLSHGSASQMELAADVLSRAIEVKNDYAPAHEVYAGILVRVGRIDEAREHYRRAARLNPRLSHPLVGLGQIALRSGDLDKARSYLEEALARNPNHGEAHHALAQVFMVRGDDWRASYHADRARELPQVTPRPDPLGMPDVEPAGSMARTDRGTMLEREGRLEDAVHQYRGAIEANPSYMPAHYNLGRALARLGRFDEAARHLAEAVRLKSTDRGSRRELSLVLRRLGRLDEAEEQLRAIVEMDATNAQAHHDLGTMLSRSDRLAEGVDHLTRAVELQPGNLESRVTLGLALLQLEDFEQADEHLREVLRVDPHHVRAQVALADALVARGETADGVARYREALRVKPGWYLPAQRLARVLAMHERAEFRDAPEAIRLASLAVASTGGQDALALDTLAAAYAEAGRFEDAVSKAKEALALASSSHDGSLAEEIRARMARYESRQPHRDSLRRVPRPR